MPVFNCRLIPCFFLTLFSAAAEDEGPGEFSISRTLPLTAPQRDDLQAKVRNDPETKAEFQILANNAESLFVLRPEPLRNIQYEGLVNTSPQRIATVSKLRQMSAAATLVRYWQASGDEKAAAWLRQMISAWSETYLPTGNDVNENKLYPLFVAYEALRPTFSKEERVKIDRWIGKIGELQIKTADSAVERTNRFTKAIRMIAIIGRILDRPEWLEYAINGAKQFISESLRADGTSLDLERRDTLTYHASGLRPVIELAVISENSTNLYDWEAPSGASIRKSVNYVIPYADGSKTRKEWVNTKVDLDRKRAAAGLEAYRTGRLYEPASALSLMEDASYFDSSLLPLARNLASASGSQDSKWNLIVNSVAR